MNTTGAREMVPGVDSAEGSRRLAYSDIIPPALEGVDSGAILSGFVEVIAAGAGLRTVIVWAID